MALSINYNTRVILVPQADLTFISGVLYQLDVDAFRLELKDIEDSSAGMFLPDTHRHNTQVVLSGVTYARSVEIINGFTVEFEDGQYTVTCVGANHNLADVKVANQVSLIIGNSAGLIAAGTALSAAEQERLARIEKLLRNKQGVRLSDSKAFVLDDDGSPLYEADAFEDDAEAVPYRGRGVGRRTRYEPTP